MSMIPKFSTVVWVGFLSYLAYTVYSFAQLMSIPACEASDRCLKPYVSSAEPAIQVSFYCCLSIDLLF